ncbi:MAG: hypothetical protein LBS88_04240 [Tannerellaceae bacterium]|jgi:hypothetical protein|nr:hypothetical protein [Tannerellaceae bacterium]
MDYELLTPNPGTLQEANTIERAGVDAQVATAKRFPRDLRRATNNAIAIATMDRETAQACTYALPRGGKPITGPSIHLARIIAQCYGNIRAEAKVVDITATQVVSRGTAWDLENNYASAFEVRRSIVSKNGTRYNDDMITVTGNAANAIAYRNAVFSIIPKSIIDKAYRAAQEAITGDLSDETKLIARRTKALNYFSDEYGITEPEVLKLVGKHTVNQIGAEEIALMIGFQQSLKDGDTTVEELLKDIRSKGDKIKEMIAKSMVKDSGDAEPQEENKKDVPVEKVKPNKKTLL